MLCDNVMFSLPLSFLCQNRNTKEPDERRPPSVAPACDLAVVCEYHYVTQFLVLKHWTFLCTPDIVFIYFN
jgi:hypothetical protein